MGLKYAVDAFRVCGQIQLLSYLRWDLPNKPNLFGLQGYVRGEVRFDENLERITDRFGILFVERLDSLFKLAKRRQVVKQPFLVD